MPRIGKIQIEEGGSMFARRQNLLLIVTLLVLADSVPTGIAAAAQLPIAAFARQEQIMGPNISGDGRYLVFLTTIDGQRSAAVVDLQNPGQATSILSAKKGTSVDMTWCRWANNTRVL